MIKSIITSCAVVLLLASSNILHAKSATIHSDAKRGLVPTDYFDFVFLSDTQVSPANGDVLFVKTTVNDDASGRDTQLYKATLDGDVMPFTHGTNDYSPRWSPNGKQIAFMRLAGSDAAAQSPQIFVIPSNGGEARQITFLDESISSFMWMPDAKQMLLTLNVSPKIPDKSTDEDSDSKTHAEPASSRAEPDIVVVTKPRYIRNGSGYLDDKRQHLFLFDIESQALTQLTSGADWNVRNPALSHDGQTVYFDAIKNGLEYTGNDDSDIFALDIAKQTIVPLQTGPAIQSNLVLAPNHRDYVYIQREDTYAQSELVIANFEDKTIQVLTADFDRNVTQAMWSADSKTLFFVTQDAGANRLFSVDVASGKVEPIPVQKSNQKQDIQGQDGKARGQYSIRNAALVAGATTTTSAVFTIESATELPELYRFDLSDRSLTQITRFNHALLENKHLSPAHELWFTNEKNTQVQGFVHRPVGFESDQTYPLILNIKGGPGGMWGHQWFHENQIYAAKGYAVAYVNYRGSTGYGIVHSQAVRLDYGGADYEDNMQFLDVVLAQNPWIDPKRLYVTGGSHGGFLTNWITTKTDRFKAAVTQRSVSSWISEAGTQEFTPDMMTKEFGGDLWTNFAYYWDRSPLQFANKVQTPTLIIHSDADMITPLGQGQEWFYALKANDVPVEMVIFKGETHSLSRSGKPTNLVERIERIVDWFERYQ